MRYLANKKSTLKFRSLVDCSLNDEFDEKLKTLKPVWDGRELVVSEKPNFQEWFITGKVNSFPPCFLIIYYLEETKKVYAFSN